MGKPLTRERIVEIAKAKGHFCVHRHRYRDDATRSKCCRLVNDGLLVYATAKMVRDRFHDDPRTALYLLPTP